MNPIEKNMDNMADVAKLIMTKAVERGDLTQADIIILTMWQKEKARATSVPLIKKIFGGIKEASGIIKEFAGFFGGGIPEALNLPESDTVEVDTDAI